MPRVILTPRRGGSQGSNQAPGQDNGLIRRWLSDQRSEEKQDGQGKKKMNKNEEKRLQKGIATWEVVKFETQKQKRVF